MATDEGDWAIVKCRSSDTLLVDEELCKQGVRAWSPTFQLRVRRPRMRSHVVVARPVLPGFLFVQHEDLSEAYQLRTKRKVRPFYAMMFLGQLATVTPKQLEPLREIEAQPPSPSFTAALARFVRGDLVYIKEGAFRGQLGCVVEVDRVYVLVEINQLKVRVAPFLLEAVQA